MLAPDMVLAFRRFIADPEAVPGRGLAPRRAGPARFHAEIEAWLRAQDAKGALRVAGPARAARILPEMLKADLQMKALITAESSMPDAEIDATVAAVAIFPGGAGHEPHP